MADKNTKVMQPAPNTTPAQPVTDAAVSDVSLDTVDLLAQARSEAAAIVAKANAEAAAIRREAAKTSGGGSYVQYGIRDNGDGTSTVLLFKDSEHYSRALPVAVNGKLYLIKRGQPVTVPTDVAQVIANSIQQDAATTAMMEAQEMQYRSKADQYGIN